MLRITDGTWQDVTARWSSALIPLAAGLAVAFGMLAYRISAPSPAGQVSQVAPSTVDTEEIHPLLGPDAEAPPSLLIDASELNREAVLVAALVSR